jgi:AGZA family xanthine/uracil permease-like MFS transporter
MPSALDRHFGLTAAGSTVAVEARAGVVTFLTMAYILLVNPQVLAAAGMPAADVATATALSAAAATLLMGLLARYPFALAPGMGLNAFFAYSVVGAAGLTWQQALAAVLVAGLLFVLLSLLGVRRAILAVIPRSVQLAIGPGIGFFLALIGLQNAGLVVAHPATLVALGPLHERGPLLALGGLLVITALLARRVPGALLLGIGAAAVAAWGLGAAPLPAAIAVAPALPRATLLAFDFSVLLTGPGLAAIAAFFFVDLFDTAGTLLGVGRRGGFLDAAGELPRADRAFFADAVGTTLGACLGTSPVTTYVESAAGVEEGGRTGLTAVVTAVLFLLAVVLTPLFVAVPTVATAPALIVVGALMVGGLRDLEWGRPEEAIPAFLTVGGMAFTYSIANGIALGIVSWVALRLATGRGREVPALLALLTALLLAFYAWARP